MINDNCPHSTANAPGNVIFGKQQLLNRKFSIPPSCQVQRGAKSHKSIFCWAGNYDVQCITPAGR